MKGRAMHAREVGEQEFWKLVVHGPDKTFEVEASGMSDVGYNPDSAESPSHSRDQGAPAPVAHLRWMWQGTDVEQASRIFRLRFGREPGRWRTHAEDKTVPEGHLMFDLTAVIE